MRAGAIVPRRVRADGRFAHVALVAGRALLLGGDHVEVEITVGPGCGLVLEDIGGTVAYDGEDRAASWHTRIVLGDGASISWAALPFVVATGAEVTRTLIMELGDGATAAIRETLVLGRVGEIGGRVTCIAQVSRSGRPILVEELRVGGGPGIPGVGGKHRIFDTVMTFGEQGGQPTDPAAAATRLELEHGGSVHRWLGDAVHRSPLATALPALLPTSRVRAESTRNHRVRG